MRKGCLIILCCLLMCSFFTAVSGKTIYVDKSGGKDYTSIQDAINSSSDDDTIFVYNGTYYENILVDKSINIVGENKEGTIIDGNGVDNGVTIIVNWVNFSGFTVQNGNLYGIDGEHGDYYFSPKHASINNVSSDYTNISDNIIKNNTWGGIFFRSSNNTVISSNIIENSNVADGINLWGDNNSNNIISSNTIENNNASGIIIWREDNNIIFGNTIAGNEQFGIWLPHSNNNIVFDNVISTNKIDGIFFDNSSVNNVSENTITGNDFHNIAISDSSQNNISANTITGDTGIWLGNFSDTKIFDNNINNCSYGIYILGSTANQYNFDNNIFANNGQNIFNFPYSPSKSPGFELIFVLIAVALVLFWQRRRIWHPKQ